MDIKAFVGSGSQFGTLVLGSLVVGMERESMDFLLVVAMETLEPELGMLEVEQVLQVAELELVVLVVLVEVPELGVLASVLAEHC